MDDLLQNVMLLCIILTAGSLQSYVRAKWPQTTDSTVRISNTLTNTTMVTMVTTLPYFIYFLVYGAVR